MKKPGRILPVLDDKDDFEYVPPKEAVVTVLCSLGVIVILGILVYTYSVLN